MLERLRSGSVVLFVLLVLVTVSSAAQAASSVVTIGVPPTQRLEGTTEIVVGQGPTVQIGRLTVKSNIPWVLVARTSGPSPSVAWKGAASPDWQMLGTVTTVLRGERGVYAIEYQVKRGPEAQPDGQPVVLTFALEAAY